MTRTIIPSPDKRSSPEAPTKTTLALCTLSGALAGIIVATFTVGAEVGFRLWVSRMPMDDLFAISFWPRVWNCLDGRFIAAPIAGVFGGYLTGLILPKNYRRPHLLMAAWASIIGAFGFFVAINMLADTARRGVEVVMMLGFYLTIGAIYGAAMGVFSTLADATLKRITWPRRQSAPTDERTG